MQIPFRSSLIPLTLFGVSTLSSAQFYDFEGLPNGFNAPNAVPGLNITTGSSPNALVLGQTFTWTQTRNDFRIFDIPSLAWSGQNSLYTENTDDFLIDTGSLQKFASILTDPGTPESPDVVRLLGLNALGANQFQVVALSSGFDNATTQAGCTLAINYAPGFRYVMLQVTSESEAFDNLTLNAVPEPATVAALGLGVVAVLRRRRRA